MTIGKNAQGRVAEAILKAERGSPQHDKGKCRGTRPNNDRCTNLLPKAAPGQPQPSLCPDCLQRLGKWSGSIRSGAGTIS